MEGNESNVQSDETNLSVNFFKSLSTNRKVVVSNPDDLTLSALVSRYGCQLIQGKELWKETLNLTKIISTGCPKIDSLMDGGLFTGELCELFGPPSSGKTQFAFNLTASVLVTKKLNVLYYDLNGSYSSKRIAEIIDHKMENHTQMEMREILAKLHCVQIFNVFELISHLENIKDRMVSSTDKFIFGIKLIVIDSINSIITPILGGSQTQGHALMIKLSLLLKEISYENNIAVILLNGTVTAKNHEYMNSKFKPALGKHWLPVPAVRVFLDFASASNLDLRSLVIHKHNRLPTNQKKVLFNITESGLTDYIGN